MGEKENRDNRFRFYHHVHAELCDGNGALKKAIIIGIFALGVVWGTILWPHIKLPFHNSWGIVSALTKIKFNPLTNVLRFMILVSLPSMLLVLIYALNIRRSDDLDILFGKPESGSRRKNRPAREHPATPDLSINLSRRLKIGLTVALALFSLIIALSVSSQSRVAFAHFEPYHDGESLGTAVMYLKDQAPYRDFVMTHGLYQDPLSGVLAFKLFGRSIGALWTMETVNSMIAIFFLVLLLYYLFQGNFLYIFLALLALMPFYCNFFMPNRFVVPSRDLMTFLFLLTVVILYRFISYQEQNRFKIFVCGFLFAFAAAASFAYSIDRAFYITAAFVVLLLIIYPLYFHRQQRLRLPFVLAVVSGLAVAVLAIGIFVHWDYLPFMKFLLRYQSQSKWLIDGRIYPRSFKYSSMCLLIAANTYWIVYKAVQTFHQNGRRLLASLRTFMDCYMIELTLLVISLLTFSNALRRPDWGQIIYSVGPSIILSVYIVIKHYLHPLLSKYYPASGSETKTLDPPAGKPFIWSPTRIVLVSLVAMAVILFSVYQLKVWARPSYFGQLFPAADKDSEVVPGSHQNAAAYLKPYLGPNDDIASMTNDASWYYLLDKRCPVRFPSVVVASLPASQRQVVKLLDGWNVKFVIYRSKAGYYAIDGIPNEKRLPIIFGYIKENYHPFADISGHEIWVSDKYEPRPPPDVIDAGGSGPSVFISGWHCREGAPGEGYRWTRAEETATCALANDPSRKEVLIEVKGFPPGAAAASFNVFVDGVDSGEYTIPSAGAMLRVKKPKNAGETLMIQIKNRSAFRPAGVMHNSDLRVLGVALRRIWQE